MTAAPLSQELTDRFARRIIAGEWSAGYRFTLDELSEETGKSRTVAREVMRDLEGLRLIIARRRIGLEVLPATSWNVFDPRIIRLRLDSSEAQGQYRSLMELRRAVEPIAAQLCAVRAAEELHAELLETAAAMRVAGEAGELEEFLSLDIRFHELVLEGSGNEMFLSLSGNVSEVLRSRTVQGRMPTTPEEYALDLHERAAAAIAERRPDAARLLLEQLVEEASAGLEQGFDREAAAEAEAAL